MDEHIKEDIKVSFQDKLSLDYDIIDINPYISHVKVTPEQVNNFSKKNAEVATINLLAPQLDKVKVYLNNEISQLMNDTNQEHYNAELSDGDVLNIMGAILDD